MLLCQQHILVYKMLPLGGANKWLRGFTCETTPEPDPVETGVGTSEVIH